MVLVTLPSLAFAASTSAVPVEGMPQLAFGHPEQGRLLVGQMVWQLLIFAALVYLMAAVALPRVGAASPEMIFSIVDFPAPFAPITAT